MGRKENIKRMKRLKELKKQRERQTDLDMIAKTATDKLSDRLSKEQNTILTRNHGPVKYSELLQEVVAPYLDKCTNYKETNNLFHAGALAWNMSVMKETVSEEEYAKVVDDAKKLMKSDEDLYSILKGLIDRKEQLFKKHKVIIAGVELTETGKDYGISVAVSQIK